MSRRLRPPRIKVAIALALLAPFAVVHAACPALARNDASATGSPVPAAGDFAGLVDIGNGRRLWLECRGSGGPTVILEAGAGNDADTWDTVGLPPGQRQTAVLPGVAAFTRVCAYDRPGTVNDPGRPGRSDPAPMPRTAATIVADLHALLGAARVPGPYVLVGHSFGGLVVRLYAATYPDEVAGMVLVDAAHEDWYAAVRAVLPPTQRADYDRLAAEGPAELAADPDRERLDTTASAAELRAAAALAPLPPVPLVVLTHGEPWDWPSGYPVATLETTWLSLQERLAALSPHGRLVVAEGSGHFIPGDRPDLIVAAVQEVVDAVRRSGSQLLGSVDAPMPSACCQPPRP